MAPNDITIALFVVTLCIVQVLCDGETALAPAPAPQSQTSSKTLMDFILTNRNVAGLSWDANNETWYANYDPTCKTVYIVPGYLTGKNEEFVELIDAYMRRSECYNLILCDWPSSYHPDYIKAAQSVYRVGSHLGQHIITVYGLEQSQNTITIVGQGMGSHIAGCAGKTTANVIQVDVIHGLDPEGDLFTDDYKAFEDYKLLPSDAARVICLHTNTNGRGTSQDCGKFDFYANNGGKQPGIIFEYEGYYSHMRSLDYFIESVTSPEAFVAHGPLGFPSARYGPDLPKNTPTGRYYFKTNEEPPYGQH